MTVRNLLASTDTPREYEVFEPLLQTKTFKLERIVSTGQATPDGQWYDQDLDEWIVLLSGEAALLFEGNEKELVLRPGDSLLIPAHERHHVTWTASGKTTVWLALHFSSGTPS